MQASGPRLSSARLPETLQAQGKRKNAGRQICSGKSTTLPLWNQVSAGHADRSD